ncbi:MAG TPA: ABC transporter permease [Gammaproteobacteria bacterium]|jgi:ABC-type antimicrobial peptide transport system permease subunit
MGRSQRIAGDVLASLLAHKPRTFLMMLGLVVGVAVLSAVIIIGQGTQERIMGLVQMHGLDMLMVRAGGEMQVFAPQADRGLASLVEADARAIEAEIPNIEMASVVQNQRGITVVHEDQSVTTRAFGVEPAWMEIRRWGIAEGDFISESDIGSLARVVMLGAKIARELFPEGGSVGRIVRVAGDPYTVKGVFVEMGASAGGDDWDDRIVVPFATSSRRLFNRPYLEQIVIRVPDVRRMAETAARVRALLRVRHGIGPSENDDFFVREPEDVEGAALETSTTLMALLIATSVVALIAGGLVIMNLMLIAVSQRSREIGLRRAVGARASDITRQFLLESLFIALAGGLLGTALGVAVAAALGALGVANSRITWVPFALALGACMAIGIAFGVRPARQAARMDPAASLRGHAA